jgi:hypothetical protein
LIATTNATLPLPPFSSFSSVARLLPFLFLFLVLIPGIVIKA